MAYAPVYTTDDGAAAGTDIVVGVLAGGAGFAILIGLGVGIGLLMRAFKGKKIVGGN